jgi:hypothetical protein
MGNCSPKTFHYESPPGTPPVDCVWFIDGPTIIPEPLEREYRPRPNYEPIWLRALPEDLEPLRPLKKSEAFTQEKPFKGKLAPLKLF